MPRLQTGNPGAVTDGFAPSCPANKDSWANIAIMRFLVGATSRGDSYQETIASPVRGLLSPATSSSGGLCFSVFVPLMIKFPTGLFFFIFLSEQSEILPVGAAG